MLQDAMLTPLLVGDLLAVIGLAVIGLAVVGLAVVAVRRRWRRERAVRADPVPGPDGWRLAGVPPGPERLIGREEDLRALRTLAEAVLPPRRPRPADTLGRAAGPALICLVSGPAGVGKTALVVQAARQLTDAFPDGRFYLNLRGSTSDPVSTAEALGTLLRALRAGVLVGPSDEETQEARCRALLTHRRVLLILDDVAGPEQLAPLLPTGPGCLVLATARQELVLPAGGVSLALAPLAEDAAITLVLPEGAPSADPIALATLVGLCDRLPLALRIIAGLVRARPGTPLVAMVDRLLRERLRLERRVEDSALRASLALSYTALGAEESALFRWLSVLPGPDFAVPTVAELIRRPVPETERVLRRLVAAGLLERGLGERYHLHPLVQAVAAERLRAEESPATHRGLERRMLAGALAAARGASETAGSLRPGASEARHLPTRGDPAAVLDWFERERGPLTAVLRAAVSAGEHHVSWRLAVALGVFFELAGTPTEWVAVQRVALRAARASRDPYAAAVVLHDLGDAHRREGHPAAACTYLVESQKRFAALDCPQDEARVLVTLGRLRQDQDNVVAAVDCYRRALAIFRAYGLRRDEIEVFTVLGVARRVQGRWGEAAVFLTEALSLGELSRVDRPVDRLTAAVAADTLGVVCQAQGRPDEAMPYHAAGLVMFRELRDRRAEAYALRNLGECARVAGDFPAALAHYRDSLTLCGILDDQSGMGAAWSAQGLACAESGRWTEAETAFDRAVEAFRVAGDRHQEGLALLNRVRALRCAENDQTAVVYLQMAEKLLDGFGATEMRQVASLLAELTPDAELIPDAELTPGTRGSPPAATSVPTEGQPTGSCDSVRPDLL